MPYIVMLRDSTHADSTAVSLAVDRFRREFDRWLGSRVESAFTAFQLASDAGIEALSEGEKSLALEFGAAYQAAQAEGLGRLSDKVKAYFEIQLT